MTATTSTDDRSQHSNSIVSNAALEHLSHLMPVQDITGSWQSLADSFCSIESQNAAITDMSRILFRRGEDRHCVLRGIPGTGLTTTLQRLGNAVCSGEVPRLEEARVFYVDVKNVGAQYAKACLETLFEAAKEEQQSVLFLIDELHTLLQEWQGGSSRPLFKALASRRNVSIAATTAPWHYSEVVANDSVLQRTLCCCELHEPLNSEVRAIADHFTRRMGRSVSTSVVERSIAITDTFLVSESQPSKLIRTLQHAMDERDFNAASGDDLESSNSLSENDIIRVVSRLTGIPESTIGGEGRDIDFQSALADSIVGQDEAVNLVATELEMISAGLSEPNKPASVLMFAGTTGVGKTELAKRIAKLYSSSGTLRIYPMGNYTESHSVSGIVGVPPGYVGHEQGGRIVNDLLSDPYSVFLLDEAEKCHPNIWKPFLNLFDEGWIADQRGRKAYGDRAIFILTTNAGDRAISQLTQSGKSREEVADQVRKTLSRVRQERSSQPVFPPQFLSRIRRIMVFNPLSEEALTEIAGLIVKQTITRWSETRNRRLVINKDVIRAIGKKGHELNQLANGEEGGRVIKKLVRDAIDYAVLEESKRRPDDYGACDTVKIDLAAESNELKVKVSFGVS